MSVAAKDTIKTTMPMVRDIQTIPGVLKMGKFTQKEHGVEIVHKRQMKASFGARFGHAMMAGTCVPPIAKMLF
jgi:hypothetical protein